MIIKKTYKYKLKLNKTQQRRFSCWLGSCRFVYNMFLDKRITAWEKDKRHYSKYDLIKELPPLKKEIEWLTDVPAQSLQNVIERMDLAYKAFFRGGGFPKFAKKGIYNSFVLKQDVSIDGNKIKLPKIGNVKYFKSSEIKGKIKTASVIKQYNGWYIALNVEQEINPANVKNENQVGIDMGVRYFLSTSDGEHIENPRFYKESLRKLRIEQRSLNRKEKGSSNWSKQKRKLTKLHSSIANQRKDFLHKQSNRLLSTYDCLYIEDLKLKNMISSAKGTIEKPGRMVKQKSGLNRSLSDVGIGIFFNMLDYKSLWNGKEIIRVRPHYTSQTCSICNHTSKENRKSQSKFECVICGHKENADINAAKNVIRFGQNLSPSTWGVSSCVGEESLVD